MGSSPEGMSESARRPTVVALTNQKGGVGKTTTAVNLAVMISQLGPRVLLFDLDPQGNATSSLGIDKTNLAATAYDVLLDELPISGAALPTGRAGLMLVPSTPELAAAEVDMVGLGQREQRLRRATQGAAGQHDLILIDCPPSLGLLTINALTASDSVIIPIQCEFLALEGVGQLITTIDLVKRQLNPQLDVLGVLMTMFDSRTRLSSHVVDEVRKYFGDRVFNSVVPRSVRLAEAPSYGQSIAEYDAGSRGAEAYREIARETVARLHLTASTTTAATTR